MKTQDGYGQWVDVIGDLLRTPLTRLPYEALLQQLMETFGARAASWECRRAARGATVGNTIHPDSIRPDPAAWSWMMDHLDEHPLIRWFAETGDPAAQTIGRVPPRFIDPAWAATWHDILSPFSAEAQLSMPLFLDGVRHRAFVLAKSDADFTDEQLRLARRLQPLLAGVERQAMTLAQWRRTASAPEALPAAESVGLTGQELAVLQLLAQGLTATAMGRRLGISPRTVSKHLEHVYAKLRARDRLSAVIRAQRLGLLAAPGSEPASVDRPPGAPHADRRRLPLARRGEEP